MNQEVPNNRSGLLAGGNWIIDQVKMIDVYPGHEQLANISGQSQGTGGSPYNVLLDLAKLGASFPLVGAGLVGQDALGEYIIDDCRSHNIDPSFISVSPGTSTSYTDVMTEIEGGRRTFFITGGPMRLGMGVILIFPRAVQRFFIWDIYSYLMRLMRRIPNMERSGQHYLPRLVRSGLRQVLMWSAKIVNVFPKLLARL